MRTLSTCTDIWRCRRESSLVLSESLDDLSSLPFFGRPVRLRLGFFLLPRLPPLHFFLRPLLPAAPALPAPSATPPAPYGLLTDAEIEWEANARLSLMGFKQNGLSIGAQRQLLIDLDEATTISTTTRSKWTRRTMPRWLKLRTRAVSASARRDAHFVDHTADDFAGPAKSRRSGGRRTRVSGRAPRSAQRRPFSACPRRRRSVERHGDRDHFRVTYRPSGAAVLDIRRSIEEIIHGSRIVWTQDEDCFLR